MTMDIKCPNEKCKTHLDKNFHYTKMGTVLNKERKIKIQRFRCSTCKKSFQLQKIKDTDEFTEELREQKRQIQQLFCSGMTYRSIAKFLRISRNTVDKRIREIAQDSISRYTDYDRFYYVSSYHHVKKKDIEEGLKPKLRVPIYVFDEMETHLISPMMPLSIGIGFDYYNDKIVSLKVCGFKPRNITRKLNPTLENDLRARYDFSFKDERKSMANNVFKEMRKYTKKSKQEEVNFITDGKTNYPIDIATQFSGFKINHTIYTTSASFDEYDQEKEPDLLRTKNFFKSLSKSKGANHRHISAFAKFNKVCATLRLNMAVLHRKSFCTVKDVEKFQDALYVFQDWYNSRILTSEELTAREHRERDRRIKFYIKKIEGRLS